MRVFLLALLSLLYDYFLFYFKHQETVVLVGFSLCGSNIHVELSIVLAIVNFHRRKCR